MGPGRMSLLSHCHYQALGVMVLEREYVYERKPQVEQVGVCNVRNQSVIH